MLNRVGGRKTMMAMIALIAGVAIDLNTERGLSENLLHLLLFVIGSYSTANVIAKAVGSKTAAPVVDNSAVESEVIKLRQDQDQVEQYLSGMLTTIETLQGQVDNSNKRVAALISNKGE